MEKTAQYTIGKNVSLLHKRKRYTDGMTIELTESEAAGLMARKRPPILPLEAPGPVVEKAAEAAAAADPVDDFIGDATVSTRPAKKNGK